MAIKARLNKDQLRELDRRWIQAQAERADDGKGDLDPAVVEAVRRFRGWSMSKTCSVLREAIAGRYHGSAKGGRALLSTQSRRYKGKPDASIVLADGSTEEGSASVARRADELADETDESYRESLRAVQRDISRKEDVDAGR